MSNEKMEEKPPQGNDTVVKLVSVSVKTRANSHIWREFHGKKVRTVNIKDVEHLTVKLSDDSDEIKIIRNELDQLKNHANSKDDAIIE